MAIRRPTSAFPTGRDGRAGPDAGRYAIVAGRKFLRRMGGNVDEEGGIWDADAVYSVSPDLRAGRHAIDVKRAAAGCAEQGIPTV